MRVIAGSKRGTKLCGFEGDSVRPTTDRVKENIFNIIAPYVSGAQVLDLFAGTGALAVEALSRGAGGAVLCDSSGASLKLVRENLERTGFAHAAQVVRSDAVLYLKQCGRQFDIIFLDPPYNTGLLEAAMRQIAESGVLSESGIVLAERDGAQPDIATEGLALVKEKKYGRTHICVYAKQQPIQTGIEGF